MQTNNYIYKNLLTRPFVYAVLWVKSVPEGYSDMAHPWKLIYKNLVSRLEEIVNVGAPVPKLNNATSTDNFIIQTSGDYNHSSKTTYRIQIVVGGKVGEAYCSVTDIVNNSDSITNPVLVTSENLIPLGLRGGFIKFISNGESELALGDYWDVKCDVYNKTINTIVIASATPTQLKTLPGIAISPFEQTYGIPNGTKYDNILSTSVELWIENRNSNELMFEISDGLEDLETAIGRDTTLDGVADDIFFKRSDPFIPVVGQPFGAISLSMDIFYKQVINQFA